MNRIIVISIAAVVCIVVTAALIIPTFEEKTPESGWEYDDYIISDAVSASGALELITLNSTQYLHACDIGEGTITYDDGSTESVEVEKAKLKMLFIMGQSNGLYLSEYADPSTASPMPDLGQGYYYGTSSAPVAQNYTAADCSMQSIVDDSGNAVVGDLWPSLAATYTSETGIKSYVVSACWGGKSISTFEPETGEIWLYSEQVLSDSIAAVNTDYYDLIIDSYIWIQGEADDNMPIATYMDKFEEMNDAIMAGALGIDTIDTCFISKVRTERAMTISAAQEKLVASSPEIKMATTIADTFTYENGYRADYSHYTQAGDNLVGKAIGNAIADYDYPSKTSLKDYRSIMAAVPILIFTSLIMFAIGTRKYD